jgi:hypothetical protein
MLGGSFIVGNQSEASKYAAKNYADPEKFPRPMYASLKDMEKVRAFLFFFTDLIKGVVQQYDVVFIQVDLDGIQYLSIFDLLHGGIRECGVIPFSFSGMRIWRDAPFSDLAHVTTWQFWGADFGTTQTIFLDLEQTH